MKAKVTSTKRSTRTDRNWRQTRRRIELYLAQALLEAGDLGGAEQWARTGLKNKPEPRLAPLGHYVLADVYERQGRVADARREVEAALRLKASR